MFDLALKARVPLIIVSSPDTAYVEATLAAHTDMPVKPYTKGAEKKVSDTLFYALDGANHSALMDGLRQNNNVLVNINGTGDGLNVGVLYPTEKQVRDLLSKSMTSGTVNSVMPALTGLSLLQVEIIVRLTSAKHKKLSHQTIMDVRVTLYGDTMGLSKVDLVMPFYTPNKKLEEWLVLNKKFFFGDYPTDLIPRGLLLAGLAGTGKTLGAKHIASTLGIPLLKLDLSSSLSKWVGESESNFRNILDTLDNESPCVFLIDEVEKLFLNEDGDAGVAKRILSQLLWWMQEHTSRVFTIMTTNDKSVIPPELYREGRIDAVITYTELAMQDARKMGYAYAKHLGYEHLSPSILERVAELHPLTPIKIIQTARNAIKQHLNDVEQ